MSRHNYIFKRVSQMFRSCAVLVSLALLAITQPVLAQVTMETLLDRILIEDFLTRYYFDLSEDDERHSLSEYFTEDAYLDVDGTIAVGHEEIGALYERPEPEAGAPARDRSHMLLTNPVIDIDGDTATAHVIWTGILNPGVGEAPYLYEQGREDTKLIKQEGRWLITHRYISSDSGIPDRFDETYEARDNPLD